MPVRALGFPLGLASFPGGEEMRRAAELFCAAESAPLLLTGPGVTPWGPSYDWRVKGVKHPSRARFEPRPMRVAKDRVEPLRPTPRPAVKRDR